MEVRVPSSDGRVAYDQAAMGAAADQLHQLARFINAQLEILLQEAKKWQAVSSGATRDQATAAIAAIQQQQSDIAAFSAQFGATTNDSAASMIALDNRLASTIDVG
jgi:hypothetical protein